MMSINYYGCLLVVCIALNNCRLTNWRISGEKIIIIDLMRGLK